MSWTTGTMTVTSFAIGSDVPGAHSHSPAQEGFDRGVVAADEGVTAHAFLLIPANERCRS